MQHAEITELVRQLVHSTMEQQGVEITEGLHETILISGGFYCGRRFKVAECEAIWFIEEKQIKFYGDAVADIEPIDLKTHIRSAEKAA